MDHHKFKYFLPRSLDFVHFLVTKSHPKELILVQTWEFFYPEVQRKKVTLQLRKCWHSSGSPRNSDELARDHGKLESREPQGTGIWTPKAICQYLDHLILRLVSILFSVLSPTLFLLGTPINTHIHRETKTDNL